MAKICLCLSGKTLAQNLEILDKYRPFVDLADLRVDCLESDERFLIRRFPGMAGVPVILSIKRVIDGGSYSGGEGARVTMLAKGLAYAEADQRRNFAYVDLEEDLDVPSLEEAARTFGTKIIRSSYNGEGVDEDLAGKIKKLRRVGDEIIKMAVTPQSLDDVIKVYRAAQKTKSINKILHCMGEFGVVPRILAEFFGSAISYSFPVGDIPDIDPEELTPRDLGELYRFRKITGKTRVFAVSGYPLKVTDSPRFFNTVFELEQHDAIFVPIPTDSVQSLLRLAQEIGISGISVTVPYKEEILPCLAFKSHDVSSVGACNTLISGYQGWMGYNTDGAGFSDSLLSFIGRKDLRGRKLTIVGAGGLARAIAAEVYRLRGKALILNRTLARARALAESYRFKWAGLDSRGANLMDKYSHIIIQATPVGMEPYENEDLTEIYEFSGRETVIDLVYKPEKSHCLLRAEKAGCRILNGHDILRRQAQLQYTHFLGNEFPPSLASRVKFYV